MALSRRAQRPLARIDALASAPPTGALSSCTAIKNGHSSPETLLHQHAHESVHD
jgi:hypothetical protein